MSTNEKRPTMVPSDAAKRAAGKALYGLGKNANPYENTLPEIRATMEHMAGVALNAAYEIDGIADAGTTYHKTGRMPSELAQDCVTLRDGIAALCTPKVTHDQIRAALNAGAVRWADMAGGNLTDCQTYAIATLFGIDQPPATGE